MRRLLVALGLVAAAYSGLPLAGYVWDDHALVVANRVLTEPTFDGVFRQDLWCCTVSNTSGYYRPLLTVTFLVDRWLFGVAPGPAHVHSLLWHLACVTLAWALLRPRIGEWPAAAAALIFGVHPIQSEAVVWIAARNDLMAAAGVLGALLALDRGRPGLAGVAALAGCLSKENAYLVLPIAWVWRRAWGERLDLRGGIAIAAGLAVALAARTQAELGGFRATHTGEFVTVDAAKNAVVTLMGWLVYPWPLTTTASLHMPAPRPGAWPAAAVAAAGLAWVAVRGGARARWLLALAVFAWLPAANGVRWFGTLGERYLYLPMFFLVAAVAATARPGRIAAGMVAGAVAASLAALYVRVPEWSDEASLFSSAVRRAPDPYAWNMLAVELAEQERWEESWALMARAVEAGPRYILPCRHVVGIARRVHGDDAVADMIPRWVGKGCRGSQGFDGDAVTLLAATGRWSEAAEMVGTARISDPRRRISLVRGAIAARDMDYAALAEDAFAWPGGPADFYDRVAAFVLNRGPPAVASGAGPL